MLTISWVIRPLFSRKQQHKGQHTILQCHFGYSFCAVPVFLLQEFFTLLHPCWSAFSCQLNEVVCGSYVQHSDLSSPYLPLSWAMALCLQPERVEGTPVLTFLWNPTVLPLQAALSHHQVACSFLPPDTHAGSSRYSGVHAWPQWKIFLSFFYTWYAQVSIT